MYDPAKPDATSAVDNSFTTSFIQKCGEKNAFFTFKRDEREALEIDAEAKER